MATLQEWKVDEPWLETKCLLGEGPFFEKETNSVRFVDIKNKRIHIAPLREGLSAVQTIQLDVYATVTSNISGVDPRDRILIGTKTGLAVLDRKTGSYEMLAQFSEQPNERIRGNDGASDPHGRFWLGSMTDFPYGECKPEGSLYRFDGKDGKEEVLQGLIIPNSVGWSPDKKTMYFTHSTPQQVLAFDYDTDTGAVTNQRLFYQHQGTGDPDGFRVDVDGNIWHAVYGESRVLKISPEGKLVGQITLPTKNITCVEFVGTELIITTASDADSPDGSKSKALGGAVFRVDVGVKGLEPFDFKL